MEGGAVPFVLAVLIVAILIFVAILLTGKRAGYKFNIEEYQTRFLTIENKLKRDVPATYVTTIIEGDKLLDKALIEMGIPGKTMGDRLKRAGSRFTDENAVWRAHKLRNVVAHETDVEVGYKQAAGALLAFKQGLKDLGAI